jgi:hypothetical protein
MIGERTRVSTAWLDLREPADAVARSLELVEHLRPHLPATGASVIHDLGSGTGSMARWLAPLLPGPQRWILHDLDEDLLEIAAAEARRPAAKGELMSVETKQSDVTELHAHDLAGASLITASALLDLLTGEELAALIDVCAEARCPALLTLSVVGSVELAPADPLDRLVAAAFDSHQRRVTGRGRLLGPDAPAAAVEGFRSRGADVLVRPSPWRLGAAEADLAVGWLAGWIGAACEQSPDLAAAADSYTARRLGEARARGLDVTVSHADLLVLP